MKINDFHKKIFHSERKKKTFITASLCGCVNSKPQILRYVCAYVATAQTHRQRSDWNEYIFHIAHTQTIRRIMRHEYAVHVYHLLCKQLLCTWPSIRSVHVYTSKISPHEYYLKCFSQALFFPIVHLHKSPAHTTAIGIIHRKRIRSVRRVEFHNSSFI